MTAFNAVLWLFSFGAKTTTETPAETTNITVRPPLSVTATTTTTAAALFIHVFGLCRVVVSLTSSWRYEKVKVLLLMQYICSFYLQHVNHPGVVNLEEMFETPERVCSGSFPLIGSFE